MSGREKCVWTWTNKKDIEFSDYYDTSCGDSMGYYHPDKDFKYCPYCGKEIEETRDG